MLQQRINPDRTTRTAHKRPPGTDASHRRTPTSVRANVYTADKTTTLRLLLDLVAATSGIARINGRAYAGSGSPPRNRPASPSGPLGEHADRAHTDHHLAGGWTLEANLDPTPGEADVNAPCPTASQPDYAQNFWIDA